MGPVGGIYVVLYTLRPTKSLFPAGPAKPQAVCDSAAVAVGGRRKFREGGEPVRHRAAARESGPLGVGVIGSQYHVPAADVVQGIQRAAGRDQGVTMSQKNFAVQGLSQPS